MCLLAGVEDFCRLKLARGVTSSVSPFFLKLSFLAPIK